MTRKLELDSVGLHVLHNGLSNIASEMALVTYFQAKDHGHLYGTRQWCRRRLFADDCKSAIGAWKVWSTFAAFVT